MAEPQVDITELLAEDARREDQRQVCFDPVTGQGAPGERVETLIGGAFPERAWLPRTMMDVPLVRQLAGAGSISAWLGTGDCEEARAKVATMLSRERCRHDFCFWAVLCVTIKDKEGAETRFVPNAAQRVLLSRLEAMRLAGKPIRLILLKARQWGGSTLVQMYMAWLQLVHARGLNSLIVGHVKDASAEVKGMFDLMMTYYPDAMLHEPGEAWDARQPKMEGVAGTHNIQRIPARGCKIKIGTAERPDSARGGDSALVHCTEVAFWKKTEGKTPQQIIRSAVSGVAYKPMTMVVYESTANGTGNFFHTEYLDARDGKSVFEALFIPWHAIERYSLPPDDRAAFAQRLVDCRQETEAADDRHEPGSYLWKLWQDGATLSQINWYVAKRTEYTDHADMAAEYPSDDTEAFAHSGRRIFDLADIERLRPGCRTPGMVGEVEGDAVSGGKALHGLRFVTSPAGRLKVWAAPEQLDGTVVRDRYLAVVDVGGRWSGADWSVITVFDRYWMMEGGRPSIAAQWRGHIDHDLLAWKAAQIAAWYGNALLVIESNTLDREQDTDGGEAVVLLDQIGEAYPNLYSRTSTPEDIAEGRPRKWGFHTNRLTKPVVIATLVEAVRDRLWVERDEEALRELATYEKKDDGTLGAVEGGHDDILMTRAIGLYVCLRQMPEPRIDDDKGWMPAPQRATSEGVI